MNKSKDFFIGSTLCMILLLVGCGNSEEAKDSSVKSGEAIYKKSCASCHGEDLSGGAGPSLQNITDKYSKEDIKDIINNGTGTMFPVNLPDEEQENLVEWLSGR